MRVLTYADLSPGKLRRPFEAVLAAIERDDFRTADVKKLASGPYYRARLDAANRLLVQFVRHRGDTVCLALELIENHAYDRSRFLRGAAVDEDKIVEPVVEPAAVEAAPVRYLHEGRPDFHLLDKPISFDDAQDAIYRTRPPLLLVGSAGSGKTALTLEKMRRLPGSVAYVTQSSFLADASRALYFAHGWQTDDQDAEFLSLRGLLESIEVPQGRAVGFADFKGWFERNRPPIKGLDAHQAFEEIRGVLTAQPEGPLSREQYLALGVKQSIFVEADRSALHDLFDTYRRFLPAAGLFDSNLVAHALLPKATPRFDFVVVDEVQDLTNVELALILRTLKHPGQFLLCGDANQIVHPSFFSWANVRSLFWRDESALGRDEAHPLSVLAVNYRNSRAVTALANGVLKIKHARFGSIDRESNHLVTAASEEVGTVHGLPSDPKVLADLDGKTRQSTDFAVIVLRDEHKEQARRVFHTPLVFSVHEAKGLEYGNVILFRFTSSERAAFKEICEGVTPADLEVEALKYRRPRDKEDKSLEIYKFFINALYVAVTRAVRHVYVVDDDLDHPLLRLLDVRAATDASSVTLQRSSLEEWQREARKLELQGKQEQADAIRAGILKTTPVPWTVLDEPGVRALAEKAFAPNSVSQKSKQTLFEYACVHEEQALAIRLQTRAAFPPAKHYDEQHAQIAKKYTAIYAAKNFKEVLSETERYGVDYRSPMGLTPLMHAAREGNVALAEALLIRGARLDRMDALGRMAVHHALVRAYADETFARDKLGPLYDALAPQHLDLQVDGRLVTLGRHQGEFFYFVASIAQLRGVYRHRSFGRFTRTETLTAASLQTKSFASFPKSVVKELRTKRPYLNHVLAKNAVGSNDTYNKQLWVRVRLANYLPNPNALLRVVDDAGVEHWEPLERLVNLPFIEWLGDARDAMIGTLGLTAESFPLGRAQR